MTEKDKKVIADGQSREIPIFVLIAKDVCAVAALNEYFNTCDQDGCSQEHLIGIRQRIEEFETWQIEHPDQVKIPD
jgi:hypothetical protein